MTDREIYHRNYKVAAAPRNDTPFQAFFWFVSAVVLFVVLHAARHLVQGEL